MPNITIRTNNVPRILRYGYEMPEKCRKDFDYIEQDEFNYHGFFTYKGQWYDLDEFFAIRDNPSFKCWDGYSSHSYFNGILIKIVDNDRIIVGQYFC